MGVREPPGLLRALPSSSSLLPVGPSGNLGAASQLVACCGHGEEEGIAQKQGLVEGQRPSALPGQRAHRLSPLTGAHKLSCAHRTWEGQRHRVQTTAWAQQGGQAMSCGTFLSY